MYSRAGTTDEYGHTNASQCFRPVASPGEHNLGTNKPSPGRKSLLIN